MSTIPWKRVRKGLAQFARTHGLEDRRVQEVYEALRSIVRLCGNFSHSRQAVYRLGCALFQDEPCILTPVCPDYSHKNGKYTFQGMRDGVPLLFKRHRPFLSRVLKIIPGARVMIFLADHERELQHLRGVLRVPNEQFERNIQGSLKALRDTVPTGWEVSCFTDAFPGFAKRVWDNASALLVAEQTKQFIVEDTLYRASLYNKLGYPADPPEIRQQCTAHVAAQYLCFAQEAKRQNAIICNHTTASLRWYRVAKVALLHNPTVVY